MELKDTIVMMNSADYKERFKAEYAQACIRVNKLVDMLEAWERGELPFVPSCPYELLEAQAHAMKVYIGILKLRADIEGVELNEVEHDD